MYLSEISNQESMYLRNVYACKVFMFKNDE